MKSPVGLTYKRFMKNVLSITSLLAIMAAMTSCGGTKSADGDASANAGLDAAKFKKELQGDTTSLHVLSNQSGMKVGITNYGGRIVSILVPDKDGELRDVVLGFDNIEDYMPEKNPSDFGAAIGRYANRINQGRFVLDGDTVKLPRNNFGHCLHGGTDMGTLGWQYRVYHVENANDSTLVLTLTDKDGNNGFPGTVKAKVTYRLLADNTLDIQYEATTDKATVVNMTNHSYFNLSGDPNKEITDHILMVNAAGYTPVDSTFMTTGEIAAVAGTPMDFTKPKKISKEINDTTFDQVRYANGYDHNWVLSTNGSDKVPAATLYSPLTGINMEVYTNEPGIQVYTGNFLDGTVKGKKGITYQKRAAICLETQHYPDSPNKPQWPSTVLRPGETYSSHCAYKFSVK